MSEPSWLLDMAEPAAAGGQEPDWLADMAEPVEAATPEQPSYASRLGTQAGLTAEAGVRGLEFGVAQTAAQPVAALTGQADLAANVAGMASPVGLVRALGAATQGDGSFLDRVQAGAGALMDMLKGSAITEAAQGVAPGAFDVGVPGAAGYAAETQEQLADIQARTEANKASGEGGLGLDVAAGLTQLAPAVATGLVTRSPRAAAATVAAPIYGQTLAEGQEEGLTPSQAAGRAAFMTGAEFVTELPVAKLLTLPASAILREAGTSGLKQALGKIAKTAGAEGLQEAQTSLISDAYDSGALDDNKTIGEALADAGYAGLVGALTGGIAGAPAAAIEARQSGQATATADKTRADYLASVRETDNGEGGTTYVDAAGNAVGDTLDEVQLTASRLTPAEMQARLTPAAPAAPETAETPPVAPDVTQPPAAEQPSPATPEPTAEPAKPASPLLKGKKQRVAPTIEPVPPEPTDGIPRTPDVDDAGRPGSAERLSDAGVGVQDSASVGSGTDNGRVSDGGDGRSRDAGSVGASDAASAPVVAPGESDVALESAAPRVLYRGTTGAQDRIQGGIVEGALFAAADEPTARLYGQNIERIAVKPDAKILVEGTPEFAKVTGRRLGKLINKMRRGENLKTAADDAAAKARAAGYDGIEFTSMKDMGVAIFNEGAVVRNYTEQVTEQVAPAAVKKSAEIPNKSTVSSLETDALLAEQVTAETAAPAPQPAAAATQETLDDVRNQERQEDGQQGREFARSEDVRQGQAQAEGQEVASADADAAPKAASQKQGVARLADLLRSANKLDAKPEQYEDVRLTGLEGEAVERLAALFGKNVSVFRAKPGAPWKAGGALFPSDPNTLFINADSGAPATYVFMHELVHSMKRTDPETWAKLEAAMRPLLKNRERYQKGRLGGKTLAEDIVTEEMIADMMAENASNPQFWSDLYGRFGDKSAWAQFVSYMRSFLERAIDTLYTIGPSNYVSDLNKAYEALVDAAYNHARAQHGDMAATGPALEMAAAAQTQTPEFRAWFGNSKVVDDDGKPLVVYHGTTKSFDAFRRKEGGRAIWAANADVAGRYAGASDVYGGTIYSGMNVMPTYMSMRNPLVFDANGYPFDQLVFEGERADPDDIAAIAEERGHDGVIIRNLIDNDDGNTELVADHYAVFRPEQIKSAIGNRGTFDPNSPSILELPSGPAILSSAQGSPPSKSLLDEGNAHWRAGAKMWDNLNRIRILQDKAVQRGMQMQDKMNVWVRENLSRSKMRVMADKVTEDYQQPILDLMADNNLSLKQVDDYLYALHAPERNAEIAKINPRFPDGGSGMTNAEAASTLAAFTPEQTAVLKQIEAKIKALQDYKLSVMEQYGLLEPADVARLRSMYKSYVPLKTIEEGDTAPGQTGMGLDIRGSELKKALGRGSRATSPLLVSFQDMARTLVRAHKNEAGNALLELTRDPVVAGMQQNGQPILSIANPADFARPVTDAQGNVTVGVPGNWWQNEAIFITKENGVPRYIHVRDPELLAQLRRMGDAELGPAIRAIGQGTRLFARMLTQYNPVFAPVNVVRDAIQASVLALGVKGLNPLKVLAAVPANLGRIMANKARPNQRYKEFLEDGASTNAYGLNDLQDSIADMEALGISLGYAQPSKDAWSAAWNAFNAKRKAVARKRVVRTVFDALTWWNEAFENAVRLSTYNAMRDAGYTREQAAFNSKELSTNFNKKGELSALLNSVYVFVNAAMQGNRALVKFWKESPKIRAAFIGLVAAGVMQDILGSMFGGEDEESGLANLDEVGDWALDHNIIIPTGDDKQAKIPLPYGLNLPFVMGRRVSRAIRTGEGMSQVAGILNVALDNFSPIGGFEPVQDKDGQTNVTGTAIKTLLPSLLRPTAGVAFNANFMGAPIAKEPFQGDPSPAPRAYDFKPGTADYAVKLAEWLNAASGGNKAKPGSVNISPEHVQYLIGEYLGGAGRFVSDVGDISSKLSRGAEGDIDWAKAPFVRSFTGTDSRSDAYARYREIRQGVNYLKDEKEARLPLDPAYVGVRRLVERTEDRLSDLRKRRKAAYAREDMAMVRQIQEQETTLIKAVVKQFNAQQKAPAN